MYLVTFIHSWLFLLPVWTCQKTQCKAEASSGSVLIWIENKNFTSFTVLWWILPVFFFYLQIKNYGKRNETIRPEVPDTQISGKNTCEKLQNIYIKNELFKLHILQAKKYHRILLRHPGDIVSKTERVKQTLENLNIMIKTMLKPFNFTLPAPPRELQDHHNQKIYVWSVAVRLTEWSEQVLTVVN